MLHGTCIKHTMRRPTIALALFMVTEHARAVGHSPKQATDRGKLRFSLLWPITHDIKGHYRHQIAPFWGRGGVVSRALVQI